MVNEARGSKGKKVTRKGRVPSAVITSHLEFQGVQVTSTTHTADQTHTKHMVVHTKYQQGKKAARYGLKVLVQSLPLHSLCSVLLLALLHCEIKALQALLEELLTQNRPEGGLD
jgi:hypothetical protein